MSVTPPPASSPRTSMTQGLVTLGVVGLVLWGARYLVQPFQPVYTDTERHFWLPDASLGHALSEKHWVMLGVDGFGIAMALFVAGLIGLLWGRSALKLGKGYGNILQVLGRLSLLVQGLATVGVATWAFVSGLPPENASANKPSLVIAEGAAPAQALSLVASQWTLAPNNKVAFVSANLSAGGERFEARFQPLKAELTASGDDLSAMSGEIVIDATSVNTGVALRSQHAAEYLLAEQNPQIKLSFSSGVKVFAGAHPSERQLVIPAQVALMGKTISVEVKGTLSKVSDAQRAEYAIAENDALLVNSEFDLNVVDTPLDPKLFDSSTLTISARLILVPTR